MTDQIIDLQEAVMPGPRGMQGPRGEQGLPGVNAVENDEAVAGYIASSGSQTSGALVERFAPRDPRDTMVVFGDSMTVCGSDTAHQWWSIVASRLGLKVKNYGHGGSGFYNISDGVNYDTELTNAINDTSVDRSKVKYVFVNASTNDGTAAAAAATAAAAWSERCKAAYPNAEYIAFAGLFGANVRHKSNAHRLMNNMQQFERVAQMLAGDGWHVFTNSPFWLVYNRGLTGEDTLHPNDSGLAVIADYVLSGLETGTYTSLSHSMGAISPINLTNLAPGADKTTWMASLVESGFTGGDHANGVFPLASMTADYASWQAMPDTNSAVYYFHNLTVKLGADDVRRFATTKYTIPAAASGGSTDTDVIIGLDVPICPLPYPFGASNAHGEAIARWSDGLSVRINNVGGAVNPCLYQQASSPALDTPADARHWLWLHFDYLPHNKLSFWAAPSNGGTATKALTGVLSCYDLLSAGSVTVSASGRIIIPIAGVWRP